jgi:hypothetical protein
MVVRSERVRLHGGHRVVEGGGASDGERDAPRTRDGTGIAVQRSVEDADHARLVADYPCFGPGAGARARAGESTP